MKAKSLVLGVAAAFFGVQAAAQQDFSGVEIGTLPVADGLYMLTGSGGNIALSVGNDGALIVDTQYAPLSDKILAAVRAAGGGEIELVVNTHWHGDHTGGNESMAGAGATIMAQDNVPVRMGSRQASPLDGTPIPASPPSALPVLTYPDRMTLHWNGVAIEIFHAPSAHTDGDSILHFTDLNAFHMGDTFFNGGYPLIDVASGGSIDGFINAAEAVLSRSDASTKIIPGHGALATPADLRDYLTMLRGVRDSIKALVDQGRSEDEVMAARPTAAFDERWGGGFIDPEGITRRVYQSMTR